MIEYDAIEMDPLDELFDKIHNARRGEMILIHLSEYGKSGPSIRMCTAFDRKDSVLARILPDLVDKINES
jgi:hypothetical protein